METVVNKDNDRNIPILNEYNEEILVGSDDGWKPRIGGSRKHKKHKKPKKVARKHSKRR